MNPYKVVSMFESEIASYCNSRYAVATESCSASLLLCCIYEKVKDIPEVIIPAFTYPSVACAIVHSGGRVKFVYDNEWQKRGWYQLLNTRIVDSAKYLARNMHKEFGHDLVCLSFHDRKSLKLGRGSCILTDDIDFVNWARRARNSGRGECPLDKDTLTMAGYDAYMTPEQAARGLVLLSSLPSVNILPTDPYLDLSKFSFFTEANR